MKISISPSDSIDDNISDVVIDFINHNPSCTLALPTGNSPLNMYKLIVQKSRELEVNWQNINIFMLDAFYPQDPNDARSFYSYIKENLLSHINHDPEKFHILNSKTNNVGKECQKYDYEIKKSCGIDLAILGIGQNGHIAFNEPGTEFESITHLAELTPITKINNGFSRDSNIKGLTMGIKTILEAKKIFLLEKGKEKTKIVIQAIKSPISTDCPASILQKHPDCTFFLDSEAAALI